MKTDVFKKKTVILILSCVLALVLVASVTVYILHCLDNSKSNTGIFYYPVDYDENIFENAAYMSFRRDLMYGANGVEQIFSLKDDFEEATDECKFFLRYFDAIINGKYEEYTSYFVDGFFDEDPKFTMQMLYEPYVSAHSSSKENVDGKDVTLLNFYVRYKIFKNNGTFRRGIDSNSAVPQIYQLIKIDNEYRIYRILEVEFEK